MLKYMLIIFYLLVVCGCTIKNDRHDRVDFEKLSKELFFSFDYATEVIFYKNELDVTNLYFDKSNLTKEQFDKKIESALLNKGWGRISPLFEDQIIYCFDKKNEMSVVYPKKEYYFNENGDSMTVKKENLNKWVILFRYNMHGDTNCENYVKNNFQKKSNDFKYLGGNYQKRSV